MNRLANRSKFNPFYALMQLPGMTINSVYFEGHRMEILAQIKGKNGKYSICGKRSSRVHGSYCRHLQDLSVFSKEATIKLHVKKLICHNHQCN